MFYRKLWLICIYVSCFMVLMVLAGCSKSTFTTLAVTSSSTPGFTITPTPTASEITSPVTSQPEKAGPNSEAIFAIIIARLNQ